MIIFTSLEYLNRRGIAAQFARHYGRDYQLVLVGRNSIDELRRQLPPSKARRLIATVPTRDDLVPWLRNYDGPGVPWPRYAVEGI